MAVSWAAPRLTTPVNLLLAGFDWGGRTGRLGFLVVVLVMALPVLGLRFGPSHVGGWSRGHEAAVAIPFALLVVPAAGHAVRRLADMGWRGWWGWLLLAPWVGPAMLALMLLVPPVQRRPRSPGGWRVLGMVVVAVGGLAPVLGLVWTTLPVAGQAMKPALLPGDVALVRRGAGGLERGDVIAFQSPGEPPRLARLIAMGGESVSLDAGVPAIDGVPLAQAPDGYLTETFARQEPGGALPLCGNGTVGLGAPCTTRRLAETLPDGRRHAVLDLGPRATDAMPETAVPPDRLFVLADNRDAGLDSRQPRGVGGLGLIATTDVLGRVDRVLASSASSWDPRGWRPGRTLARVR